MQVRKLKRPPDERRRLEIGKKTLARRKSRPESAKHIFRGVKMLILLQRRPDLMPN